MDAYALLKGLGLRGVNLVHMNRFFSLQEFFPSSENSTRPFPVTTYDIRSEYEAGIDAHNWLFIAVRAGMVRRITTVLPEQVFEDRRKDFSEDKVFTVSGNIITGYSYDLPRMVATIESLPHISEPVVVMAEAGYFLADADSQRTAAILKKKCADVRVLVLIKATDDPDITEKAWAALASFATVWRNAL